MNELRLSEGNQGIPDLRNISLCQPQPVLSRRYQRATWAFPGGQPIRNLLRLFTVLNTKRYLEDDKEYRSFAYPSLTLRAEVKSWPYSHWDKPCRA